MIHVGHTFRTVDLLAAEAVQHDDHVDYRLLAGNTSGHVSMWSSRGFLLGLAADVSDLLALVPDRGGRPGPADDDDGPPILEIQRPISTSLEMELDADEVQILYLPEEGSFVMEVWDRDQPPEAPPALSFYPSRTTLSQLRGSILAACASRAGECCACGQTLGPVPVPTWPGNAQPPGRGPRGPRHDRGGRQR